MISFKQLIITVTNPVTVINPLQSIRIYEKIVN